MDKNTLGQYGWLVVCVVILAIMVTLATPFGTTIRNAVAGAVTDFNETGENALNGITFDAEFGGGGNTPGGTPGEDNHGSFMPDPDPTHEAPEYDEEVVIGDYTYTYCRGSDFFSFDDGWVVEEVADLTKTEYGPICETIYGKPVIGMSFTFSNCENITCFPDIPKTVRSLERIFPNTDTIKGTIVIPETVVECSTSISADAPFEVPATAYVFLSITKNIEEILPKGFKMSNKKTYKWEGKSFKPDHAAPYNGEQVIIGDFLYCYNYVPDGRMWEMYDDSENCVSGWTVIPLNIKGPYDPDKVCSSVYGKPVVTASFMYSLLNDCDVVTVPDSVTAIIGESFSGSKINTVNIPASVTYIEPESAFYGSTIGTINFEADEAPEGFVEPDGTEINYGVEM